MKLTFSAIPDFTLNSDIMYSHGHSGSLPNMTTPSSNQTLERKLLPCTSRITTPPPPLLGMKRSGEQENVLRYHTNVIAKQNLQDHIMKHEHNQDRPSSIPSTSHQHHGIKTKLSLGLNGSSPRPAKVMGKLEGYPASPFHKQSMLELSKSYSQTSPNDDANSTSLENLIKEDGSVKTDQQNKLNKEEMNEFFSMSDSNNNDNIMVSPEPGKNGAIDDPTQMKQFESLKSEEYEICTICVKEFPESQMPYHHKAHERQKPYECPICGKRFGYKNNMKSHIKRHAGIKPYQCNVCGAKFTRGSTLRRHARRHDISSESVSDMFVRNDNSSTQQPHQLADSQIPERNSTEKKKPSPSSPNMNSSVELTSTIPDGPGYSNLLNTATSAAMSNALLMSYDNNQGAIAAATYPFLVSPFQSRSDVPQNSTNFAAPSHSPQRDALDLTIHLSVTDLPNLKLKNRNFTDSASPTSAERFTSRSFSGSSIYRPTPISAKCMMGNENDKGVQVKTCCKVNIESMHTGIGFPGKASLQSGDSGAIYQQGQSSGLDNSTETISTLLSTGKLFKCDHCECYFSEYTMYRIHSNIHTRGRTMPFVCPVCGEDCHDRVYFSLHILEHLK